VSDELRDLYQEIILDHNKSPRNFRQPAESNRSAEGYNPLCGDHYTIYLNVSDGKISDVGFDGSGCAISKASASVMTTMVKGKTEEEAEALFSRFRSVITGEQKEDAEALGKLAAFAGVAEFPTRVKCALLAWHAMSSAINGEEAATTE
jgi:nitrogen fixation protein NifU and related proteins